MKTWNQIKRAAGLCAAACMPWIVSAQQTFVVRGNISGLEEGSVVTLFEVQDGAWTEVDADTVSGGVFRLSGRADGPLTYEVQVRQPERGIAMRKVWAQAGDTVVFEGDSGEVAMWTVRSRNPLQAEQTVYDRCALDEQVRIAAFRREMNRVGMQMNRAPKEEAGALHARMRSMDARKDSLEELVCTKQFEEMKRRYTNEDGTVKTLTPCGECMFGEAAFYVRYAKGFPIADDVRAFYKALSDEQRQSDIMRKAEVQLFPPRIVKEGEPMYDGAVLYDMEGNAHRLSDYNKGKYLLLDFWSVSCPPCLASFPELKEVSETYKDSLTVISINSDARKYWAEYSRKHGITWVNLNDRDGRSGIYAHYVERGIPVYVLISPEGTVVKLFTGYTKGRIKQKLDSLPFYKKNKE